MEIRECECCGIEFKSAIKSRSSFCSSKCALDDYRINGGKRSRDRKRDKPSLAALLAQPEIQALRAGIQEAIKTAWVRSFGE